MTHKDHDLLGDSLNIAEHRKKELKPLFPGAFTEMKNDQGELVEALDFERLRGELSEFNEIYDNRHEPYGMDWLGKKDCLRLEATLIVHTTHNKRCRGDQI